MSSFLGFRGTSECEQEECQLSALMMFSHIASILFIVIGIYAAKQTSDSTAHFVNWSVVMGFVFLGLLAMIAIIITNYRQNHGRSVHIRRKEDDPSLNIRIVFLWVFGLAVLFHTALYLAIIIDCGVGNHSEPSYFAASCVSNVVLLMFLIVELALVTYYRHGISWKGSKITLVIVPIVLANFCIWFNTTISNANNEYHIRQHGNLSLSNASYCFANSKIQAGLLRKIVPYLLPARMEFCILASNFIISFWSSCRCNHTGNSEASHRELYHGFNYQLMDSVDRNAEPPRFISSGHYSNKALASISVVFGILSMLPTFTSVLILSFVFRWENDATFITLQASECVESIISCVSILIIYYHLRSYYSNRKLSRSINTNDFFLILSSSGMMSYFTLGFLTGIYSESYVNRAILSRNLFSMIEVYLQTSLLIQTSRYRNGGRPSPWISSCAIILMIINLTYWFLNSYNDSAIPERQGKVAGIRIWIYAQNILVPLLIFYRFSSAMNAYSLYYKFKPA